MSSDFVTTTLPLIGIIATDAIALYAAYLALSVRRGLIVPIYRSRALWMALLAILYTFFITFLSTGGTFLPDNVVWPVSSTPFFAALIIWIGRTISTLIRLDYLRRDLFGWKKFRPLYWGSATVALVVNDLPASTPISVGVYALLIIVAVVPPAYASVVLILGSARTRDMTFRSHARWGGYCLLSLLLIAVPYFATPNTPVLQSLPLPVISYCLYKMARFLVPVGKLSVE